VRKSSVQVTWGAFLSTFVSQEGGFCAGKKFETSVIRHTNGFLKEFLTNSSPRGHLDRLQFLEQHPGPAKPGAFAATEITRHGWFLCQNALHPLPRLRRLP